MKWEVRLTLASVPDLSMEGLDKILKEQLVVLGAHEGAVLQLEKISILSKTAVYEE
jgi:hypothetical protein